MNLRIGIFILLINFSLLKISANTVGETSQIVLQQDEVSGTITTKDGEPLVGTAILEKGTANGTLTDFEGNFKLSVGSDAVLVFSYMGFITQEIKVDGQSNISIVMLEDATGLDEIVVTAYGTSNKRSFTGAAKKVSNETLSRSSTASFETALQGNVAGVNAFTSGQPGGASNVQIRGVGSINGMTQPLYVIDGVVINTDHTLRSGDNEEGAIAYNPLSSINSEDIENITVLKDAAAASLYGSRAANGVILITTKKGKRGESEIVYGVELGVSRNLTQEKTITNQQFRELWKEGQLHQYIQNNENGEFTRVYNNAALLGTYKILANQDYVAIYGPTDVNSDWLDAIYQMGMLNKHSLSVKGGSEKTLFYISGNYFDQQGTILKSDLERFSGRINLENQAKDWLNIGLNLSSAKTSRNAALYDGSYAGGLNPLYMARVLPQAAPIWDPNGYEGIANLPNGIEKNANPIGILEVGKYLNTEFRTRGNVYANIQLLKELKFKSTLGIDQQSVGEVLYDNKEFGAGGGKWNGVLNVVKSELFQHTTSNLLTYDKQLNNHGFGGLLGFESQVSKMSSINNYGYDVLDSDLLSSSSIGTLWSSSGYSENYALLSNFLQASYNYSKKYYLMGSFRRDGSSRFGKNSRWGNFWSVSGSWIVTEEDFFDIKPINHLKLRASNGTNGNLPPEYYASLAFFDTEGKDYGDKAGLSYGQLANPDLSWELSNNFNVGLDAILFKKLNLTVDYFSKYTKGLLLEIPVSATSGFNYQLQNFGEMKNNGWEIALGYTPISKNQFTWNTKLNSTFINNEITKLKGDLIPSYSSRYGQNPIIIKEGESLNSFYLREYAGVDENTGKVLYYVLNNGERTGEITADAEKAGFGIFGKALHDVRGGFYNQFTYKKISLDFLLTFGIGGEVYDRTAFKRDDDGYAPQFTNTQAQLDPWNPNNKDADIPIRINGNTSFSNDVSTRHLYSADYLKLRNMKLSYKLPRWKLIQGGSIYVQGDNLLLFTELDDYDPEAVANGVNFFQVPTATSVLLGVQLKF